MITNFSFAVSNLKKVLHYIGSMLEHKTILIQGFDIWDARYLMVTNGY